MMSCNDLNMTSDKSPSEPWRGIHIARPALVAGARERRRQEVSQRRTLNGAAMDVSRVMLPSR